MFTEEETTRTIPCQTKEEAETIAKNLSDRGFCYWVTEVERMGYEIGKVYKNFGMQDGTPVEWTYTFEKDSTGEVHIRTIEIKECEQRCMIR